MVDRSHTTEPLNIGKGLKIMKMTIRILLIGFLGFFGCSDGDDRAGTYTGQPSPITPYGRKCVKTITFEWTAVPGATEYCIWVQDLFETDIIKRTYTSEEAGCSADELTCSVTTGPESITQAVWQAQACNGNECGLWSDPLDFSISCGMIIGPRFIDNGDGTVTDTQSNFMWFKDANSAGTMVQNEAADYCFESDLGGHTNWALPFLYQFRTLFDTYDPDPPIAWSERPFVNILTSEYWAGQQYFGCCFYTLRIWHPVWWSSLRMDLGNLGVWCVRHYRY